MSKYGYHTQRILQLLEDEGPMSRAEICARLGVEKFVSSAIVSRLNRAWPKTPKRVYVSHYVYDMEGERRYPRAVFALGDLPDAKKPKADHKAVRRRSDQKMRALRTQNFVFNLAKPRREYSQTNSTTDDV